MESKDEVNVDAQCALRITATVDNHHWSSTYWKTDGSCLEGVAENLLHSSKPPPAPSKPTTRHSCRFLYILMRFKFVILCLLQLFENRMYENWQTHILHCDYREYYNQGLISQHYMHWWLLWQFDWYFDNLIDILVDILTSSDIVDIWHLTLESINANRFVKDLKCTYQ